MPRCTATDAKGAVALAHTSEGMVFAAYVFVSWHPVGKSQGLERPPGKNSMIGDPVGDLLTRIRNAALIRAVELKSPYSRLREQIVRVLKEEGYVQSYQKDGKDLVIILAYSRRKPLITGIKNVSKPGLRIYRKTGQLPRPLGGIGISIVSTPQGVMSNKDAWKKRLGGEVLGLVW